MDRRLLAVLAMVMFGAAAVPAARANHGQNAFSGSWTTNIGTVAFRVINGADGAAALQAMGGTPCAAPTTYYHGEYSDNGGTGKMTACLVTGAGHLVGRYVADPTHNPTGAGDFDITLSGSSQFGGFYTADDIQNQTFPYSGTFLTHFDGDGCCTSAEPPPAPPPPPPGPVFPSAPPPNSPTVTVTSLPGRGRVEIQNNSGGWEPARAGGVLRVNDKIHTGWKSGALLTFPDGSTLAVKPMSLVVIERLQFDSTGRLVRVTLKLGEVKATINRSRGSATDFIVKSPTQTTSVRGTVFGVLYDGTSTIVTVRRGAVDIQPNRGEGLQLPAGLEVAAGPRGLGPVLPIGRAGAPAGSFGPAKTTALLVSALARRFSACKLDAYDLALKATRRGWHAAIEVVRAGTSAVEGRKRPARWSVAGRRIAPANALARKISAGCR